MYTDSSVFIYFFKRRNHNIDSSNVMATFRISEDNDVCADRILQGALANVFDHF